VSSIAYIGSEPVILDKKFTLEDKFFYIYYAKLLQQLLQSFEMSKQSLISNVFPLLGFNFNVTMIKNMDIINFALLSVFSSSFFEGILI